MGIDIVRELIRRLLEAAHREGTLTESIALEIERSFRREFSGEQFYVKKTPDADIDSIKKKVVDAYLKTDKTTQDVADQNGISRSTLYRYLKK